LVQALLRRAIAADADAARYRLRWAQGLEPFAVKKVDDAQGDVRDVVLLSFGLAMEEGGVLEGASRLEGAYGARRLNVALSRARLGLIVFCGVSPMRIRVDHRTPRGVVLLRQFLLFAAEHGVPADGYSGACVGARQKVMEAALEPGGFRVVARAGVGEWFVDLAVAHPRIGPGFSRALCADAHASVAGQEDDARDWLRGAALERLGWAVHRIWSSEWFRDPLAEADRLRSVCAVPR
jgi:very-short-patch-repair endonuclease